jgi:hypothetical protein
LGEKLRKRYQRQKQRRGIEAAIDMLLGQD